ncbi:rab5-interacting protein (Rab5ip) domain-containing protein [Ditylenchus destructor]|uniref:Rab5-interacting protein (Rab5ip) domain-containing protein n=1 Tax=Ditylenchus destructor TaxID=166010 RepID=A0AAD4NHB6_9BILA|nr:rab5-interacting protein (Rab5ip) domain-containing protein [Ditylenchus destructor]
MGRDVSEKNTDESWSVGKAFSKALKSGGKWEDKDELLDVLYWGRQIMALIIGLLWGFIPLKGIIAIFIYVICSSISGHFYLTAYQKQDEEVFGGFWEIAKEGFGAAFATFMVSWIVVYSALHFNID